jgi:hypothetical protein
MMCALSSLAAFHAAGHSLIKAAGEAAFAVDFPEVAEAAKLGPAITGDEQVTAKLGDILNGIFLEGVRLAQSELGKNDLFS